MRRIPLNCIAKTLKEMTKQSYENTGKGEFDKPFLMGRDRDMIQGQ